MSPHVVTIEFKKKFGQKGFTVIIRKNGKETERLDNVRFNDTITLTYNCGYREIVKYVNKKNGFNPEHLLSLLIDNGDSQTTSIKETIYE